MISHPTAVELAEAADRFEARAGANFSGRDAFLARVTANARALIAREAEHGPAAEAANLSRLAALLGHDGEFAVLNDELCAKLASGAVDLASPGVMDHLKASTIDQVAIDQPSYSGLAAARGDT